MPSDNPFSDGAIRNLERALARNRSNNFGNVEGYTTEYLECDGNIHEIRKPIIKATRALIKIKVKFKGIAPQTNLKNPSMRALKVTEQKTKEELLLYGLKDTIKSIRETIRLNSLIELTYYSSFDWSIKRV